MTYKAVDHHNMMEGRGFRVEQLKIQTFVFRFLGLVVTHPYLLQHWTIFSVLASPSVCHVTRRPNLPHGWQLVA